MKKRKCLACNHVYDEEKGDPKNAVRRGTRFNDLPDDWSCPVCGVNKEYYKRLSEEK
ncbi:MAG: rubredoxin [Elusimicrobia bacterium]|nr:rubredoxin [Candidatus Liberimonas magnetica]